MTALQKSLNDYLALRRALGFKLVREGMWLPSFVRSVEAGSSFLTTKVALRWAMGEKKPPSKSWPNRLRMVRKFAQYMHAHNSRHEVPSTDLVPRLRSDKRFEAYIYSDTDVLTLMREARKIRTSFRGETYATLIGLLASTGMRVGEAIGLDRSDFDPRQGLLQIRNTKFGKSRQLIVHPTTTKALCEYAKKRDRAVLHPSSRAFFPSTTGTRLIYRNFNFVFLKMVRSVGLDRARPQRPRIHDLRHTFAINTLTTWYRAGLDTGPRLPALSTYLGHVCPSSTYHYLRATPELLQQASRRLEKSQARGARS